MWLRFRLERIPRGVLSLDRLPASPFRWLLPRHKASENRRLAASDEAWKAARMNAGPSARIETRLAPRPAASLSASVFLRLSRSLSASVSASMLASVLAREKGRKKGKKKWSSGLVA